MCDLRTSRKDVYKSSLLAIFDAKPRLEAPFVCGNTSGTKNSSGYRYGKTLDGNSARRWKAELTP
jgi:hypothetical protein